MHPSHILPHCSGPLEHVCRRWRRLVLQLPASLSIDLCALHDLGLDEDAAAAAIERLLPHLSCRNAEALAVVGCTVELAPQVPAALARALYPELRRLVLCYVWVCWDGLSRPWSLNLR